MKYLFDNNYYLVLYRLPIDDFDFYYYNQLTEEQYYFKIKEDVKDERNIKYYFRKIGESFKRIPRFIQKKN